MGATNYNNAAMPITDFTGRLADIARHLQALDLHRKAAAAVRHVLTAPVVNRVEADQRAIERLRQLAEMPLPKLDVRDEE